MKIIDVSHYQGDIDWKKVKADGVESAIIKCSQGSSNLDSWFSSNKKEAREAGVLLGYYHFANGTDYKKEADWFIKCVGDIQEGEFVALDFEINISNPAEWCKNWLDYVTEKLGFKPLLYTNAARVKSIDWTIVSKADYGLWVARYGDNDDQAESNEIPDTDEWSFYAIWQYSSNGTVSGISGRIDLDTTGMNLATLKKYGKPSETTSQDAPESTEEVETTSDITQTAETSQEAVLEANDSTSTAAASGETSGIVTVDTSEETESSQSTESESSQSVLVKMIIKLYNLIKGLLSK